MVNGTNFVSERGFTRSVGADGRVFVTPNLFLLLAPFLIGAAIAVRRLGRLA